VSTVAGMGGRRLCTVGGCLLTFSHFGLHDWATSSETPPFGSSCAACGARLSEEDDRAETINRSTGARGVCHAECYLADQCCYELA
jgi:hypothetical protein